MRARADLSKHVNKFHALGADNASSGGGIGAVALKANIVIALSLLTFEGSNQIAAVRPISGGAFYNHSQLSQCLYNQ